MTRLFLLLSFSALFACKNEKEGPDLPEMPSPFDVTDRVGAYADPEAGLTAFLADKYGAELANQPAEQSMYAYTLTDLNGDGNEEALVALTTPYFCNDEGCLLLVMSRSGGNWQQVTNVKLARFPVYVSEKVVNGWREIMFLTKGAYRALPFDGKTYPPNPTGFPAYTPVNSDTLQAVEHLIDAYTPTHSFFAGNAAQVSDAMFTGYAQFTGGKREFRDCSSRQTYQIADNMNGDFDKKIIPMSAGTPNNTLYLELEGELVNGVLQVSNVLKMEAPTPQNDCFSSEKLNMGSNK